MLSRLVPPLCARALVRCSPPRGCLERSGRSRGVPILRLKSERRVQSRQDTLLRPMRAWFTAPGAQARGKCARVCVCATHPQPPSIKRLRKSCSLSLHETRANTQTRARTHTPGLSCVRDTNRARCVRGGRMWLSVRSHPCRPLKRTSLELQVQTRPDPTPHTLNPKPPTKSGEARRGEARRVKEAESTSSAGTSKDLHKKVRV